jgi:diaminohydroxyphosphoribosylaminopyrimidine deaminase/5-amino-6-(5-phosphoribosylamino)uracil reductase
VETGVGAEQATALNQAFLTLIRERRPFVILKAATSLDGAIAVRPGERTRLTSVAADRHAHAVRAEVDAIGVGSGTIRIDNPLLTSRDVYRERPLTRVIFDRRLSTPPTAAVLSTRGAGPVIIVTTARNVERAEVRILRPELEARGADIEVAEDDTVRAVLERLAARGIGSLLLEGGAALHLAAWREQVVDYVRLYVTPHVIGPCGVPLLADAVFSTTDLARRGVRPLGPDVVIEGYVHGPH